MVKLLENLSVISFAAAGICLVLAIFFWFFFNIPNVIGDLSGRTARKSIAKMRAANENTGVKSYKGSKTNADRGKITATMENMGKVAPAVPEKVDAAMPETGMLAENMADGLESEATALLGDEQLVLDFEGTELLVDEEATAPLVAADQAPPARPVAKRFELIEEVMFIHTDEVIG